MSPAVIYEFVREKVGAISAGPKNAAAGYLHKGLGVVEVYEWVSPEQSEYLEALREYLHAAFRERMQRGDPVGREALAVARHRAYMAREDVRNKLNIWHTERGMCA